MTARLSSMRVGVLAAALYLLFSQGCACEPTFPRMRLQKMEPVPSRFDRVKVPSDGVILDRSVAEDLFRLKPQCYLPTLTWNPAPANTFAAEDASEFRLVRLDVSEGLSPYHSERMGLFDRVIVRTRDGRYYYTPKLDSRYRNDIPEKYIPIERFELECPTGVVAKDGTISTKPIDPLEVACSGYVVTVSLPGSGLSRQVVVPPRLSDIDIVDFNAPHGLKGKDGTRGYNGAAGRRGHDGRPGASGASGRSYGESGMAGRSGTDGLDGGNGGAGARGADGERGEDGASALALSLTFQPLKSDFFENPLIHIVCENEEELRNVVVPWAHALEIQARGGNGGDGGKGGDGGDGGVGGRGGNGGAGGSGGSGMRGARGQPGRAGRDATRSSSGEDGGPGGRGGNGGNGGDGGDGGDAGNGGDGGDGGHGGRGGDGGHGGDGAAIIVAINGTGNFAEMVKTAVSYNVDGGIGGAGGEGGAPGKGGDGGLPGAPGSGGRGGSGGSGGPGGPGGPGGNSCSWIETVPMNFGTGVVPMPVACSNPGGNRGPNGPSGARGYNGNAGNPGRGGKRGREGQTGIAGPPGRDGFDGEPGTVIFTEDEVSGLQVACDLRLILVSDGTAVGKASANMKNGDLAMLADTLASELQEYVPLQGEAVAVANLRNRSENMLGKAISTELADKIAGSLIAGGWFDVKERIDLTAIIEEKDLENSDIVKNREVISQLSGVKYVVIGGVTVKGEDKPAQ